MSDVVLAALIGAVASIIVNLITASRQSKKQAIANAVREKDIDDRLIAIEHKLDVHNGYAEKLGAIATDIAVMKTKISTITERS